MEARDPNKYISHNEVDHRWRHTFTSSADFKVAIYSRLEQYSFKSINVFFRFIIEQFVNANPLMLKMIEEKNKAIAKESKKKLKAIVRKELENYKNYKKFDSKTQGDIIMDEDEAFSSPCWEE